MSERFADLPGDVRQSKLERARLDFDWLAGQGPLGGILLHMRYRAEDARRTARLFLVLLFLTVISGLIFYLGLPFWQSFVDGRRSTLQATLQTITTEKSKVDRERGEIVTAGDRRPGLPTLLRGMPEVVETGAGVDLNGHIVLGNTVLIYGEGSTIIRSTDGGASFDIESFGTGSRFTDHAVLGETVLIYAEDGPSIISVDGGANFTAVEPRTEPYYRDYFTVDNSILSVAEGSKVLRSTNNGRTFEPVVFVPEMPKSVGQINGHIVLNDTVLFYGETGAVVRSTDAGATFTPIVSGTKASLYGHIVLGSTVLIYSERGQIVRSTDGGATFKPIESGLEMASPIIGHIVLGNTILIYTQSAIFRSADHGATFAEVMSGIKLLSGHMVLGKTILLYGFYGNIIRSIDDGKNFVHVEQVEPTLNGLIGVNNIAMAYGEGGAIIRSTDGGATFASVALATDQTLTGDIVLGDKVLIYGNGGAVVRLTDQWADQASALTLDRGTTGDDMLVEFLDKTLPENIRAWDGLRPLRDRLSRLQSRRGALNVLQDLTDKELLKLDKFPYAYLQRERKIQELSGFLTTCRGEGSFSPDITATCLTAWQAQQTAGESWWQALVDQVPPGILLLFLLATSGGLYRYNVRLAGFHDSRADALQLLAHGRDEAQLRDVFAASPGDAVNFATIFLAADKVEMGTIRAKLGQAEIELAKALNTGE